jgi:drug/metabolite transporter (DMT)-like permease
MDDRRTQADSRRPLLGAVIVGLCVAALVAIGAIAGDDELDETSAKAIGSAAAVMIFASTALGSETLRMRRADMLWLAYAGFVVAGIGLVVTLVAIWSEFDDDSRTQGALSLLVASLALGHVSILLAPRHAGGPKTRLLRGAAVGLAALLAVGVIVNISSDDESVDWQALAVVAVLYLLATLLVPLVRRLESAPSPSPPGPT